MFQLQARAVRPPRARVRMKGDFDVAVREALQNLLVELREQGCVVVEIDAQEVSFIDSGCLRVLHLEAWRLASAGGVLRLVAASGVFSRTACAFGYLSSLVGCTSPSEADQATGDPPAPSTSRDSADPLLDVPADS